MFTQSAPFLAHPASERPRYDRQITARVRRDHLEPGEPVQSPIENHSREKERGFKRIADDVTEAASTIQRAWLDDVARAVGMHEYRNIEFLCFRPERIVFCRRRCFSLRVPENGGSPVAKVGDGVFQLLGSHLRKLQCRRGEWNEAIGVPAAPLRKPLIVYPDDLPSLLIGCRIPPKAIHAERRDIDTPLVQRVYPVRPKNQIVLKRSVLQRGPLDHRTHLLKETVGVNIDDSHPAPAHEDFLSARLRESVEAVVREDGCSRGCAPRCSGTIGG